MRFNKPLLLWLVGGAALAAPVVTATQGQSDAVSAHARELHMRAIVIDTHDDATQRLIGDEAFDIAKRNTTGNIDIPRMREGGLDALFFSICVPGDVTGAPAVKKANELIDAVEAAVRAHPKDLMLAKTAADIRRAAADHKIAALMGMEGGHMIRRGRSRGRSRGIGHRPYATTGLRDHGNAAAVHQWLRPLHGVARRRHHFHCSADHSERGWTCDRPRTCTLSRSGPRVGQTLRA